MTAFIEVPIKIGSPTAANSALTRIASIAVKLSAAFTLLFLITPVLVVVPMSFSNSSSLRFPPEGLSLRWYAEVFSDSRWVDAMLTSLALAVGSSTLALVLGGPAAYGLARGRFSGRLAIQSNFISPMVVPSVVVAVALYFGLARIGMLGTFTGLLLGHTLLGCPYVVLILSAAIRAFDIRIEQVAFTLGASWPTMFWRVLIPNLVPSVFAAWIFAFVTSFDEVVVTAFIAGSHETVPKRMFNELILQVNPSITAIATLLIVVSLALMGLAAVLVKRSGLNQSRAVVPSARSTHL
jgi:putative spermidine/putrescine transport system permease protein